MASAAAVMRRRPRAGRGHDAGFTLVEVLVVVSIAGIIVSALAGLLIQGFQRIPEAEDRTAFAGDVARLTDAFSDDIANAQGPSQGFPFSDVDVPMTCTRVLPDWFELRNFKSLGVWEIHEPTPIHWTAVLFAYDSVYNRVEIRDHGETMLLGYCRDRETEPVVVTREEGLSFTVTIRLASRPGGEVREIRIGGDRRTTG